MVEISSSYLGRVYRVSEFQKIVDLAVKAAIDLRLTNPYEAIAFTGQSGSALAYILSYRIGVPLICVRKSDDSSHFMNDHRSYGPIEGCISARKYLFVDDFIDSGATLRRVLCDVFDWLNGAKCVAILLYGSVPYPSEKVTNKDILETVQKWVLPTTTIVRSNRHSLTTISQSNLSEYERAELVFERSG